MELWKTLAAGVGLAGLATCTCYGGENAYHEVVGGFRFLYDAIAEENSQASIKIGEAEGHSVSSYDCHEKFLGLNDKIRICFLSEVGSKRGLKKTGILVDEKVRSTIEFSGNKNFSMNFGFIDTQDYDKGLHTLEIRAEDRKGDIISDKSYFRIR